MVVSIVIALFTILAPLIIWIIRVEKKLTELCGDIKFLKSHILKWNMREPVS